MLTKQGTQTDVEQSAKWVVFASHPEFFSDNLLFVGEVFFFKNQIDQSIRLHLRTSECPSGGMMDMYTVLSKAVYAFS